MIDIQLTMDKEYQFVEKYLKILGFFVQKCTFINGVNCWDISTGDNQQPSLSRNGFEGSTTNNRVQMDSNVDTSAPHPQLDDDIV